MRATPLTHWKKVIVTQHQLMTTLNTRAKLREHIVAAGLDPDHVLVMEETKTGTLVFAQRDQTRKLGG